jgi:hypothetical protein
MQHGQSLTVRDHARLVPVAIDPDQDRVDLLAMRGVKYAEPFFHETVSRRRREFAGAPGAVIDIETFQKAASHHQQHPGAFIFHTGRCGSTLLANLLSATRRHVLIKEPRPVSDPIAAWLTTDDPESRRRMALLVSAAVRHLSGTAGARRYKVFKLAAWNVRLADILMNLFPKTGSVFVYRSPLEVVASLMFQPPAWLDLIYCPRKLQCCFFPSLKEVPEHEPLTPPLLFAHAWRSCAEAALAQPSGRMLLVEYSQMVLNPTRTVERVLAHLNHEVSAGCLSSVARAATTYSKDPLGKAAFDPAGAHRRPALAASEESCVREITANTAARLRHGNPV